MAASLEPLSRFPTEVLANILSFAETDSERICDLLLGIHLLQVKNPTTRDEEGERTHNNDDHHHHHQEDIFRALCLFHWHSLSEKDRPQYFTSWKTLYRVLAQWVPKQGFYSLLEAAPWGMLVRLRFLGGNFVGDILWPAVTTTTTEEEQEQDTTSSFQSVRFMDIRFDPDNGSVTEIFFCNDKMNMDQVSLSDIRSIGSNHQHRGGGPVPLKTVVNTVRPVIIPGCPPNYASHRAIRLEEKLNFVETYFHNFSSSQRSWRRLWDPFASTPPEVLIHVLFSQTHQLTFDWVEGPSKLLPTFQYEEDSLPLLQPGLYSGVYEDMYGKFKREIILVEYLQYHFSYSNEEKEEDPDNNNHTSTSAKTNNNNNARVWDQILYQVFNFPDQTDYQSRLHSIQDAVANTRCKTVVFVVGKKVTGDIHVPMNKITFGALVSPLVSLSSSSNGSESGTTRTASLSQVTNKGNGKVCDVVRSWEGWGTLAYPMFGEPRWASGALVQVRDPDDYRWDATTTTSNQIIPRGKNNNDQLGFVWQPEGTAPHASILTRMPEQDDFPWFA